MRYLVLVSLFVLCFSSISNAQTEETPEDSTKLDRNIIALPIVFFIPETSWAFGLAGNYKFRRTSDPNSKPSQISLGGAYTLNKQILSYLSYSLFSKNNQWWWQGEFGYYDYVYDFEGIGFDNRFPLNKFFTTFPEVKTKLSYELAKNYFIGIGYYFANYSDVSWSSDEIYEYNIRGTDGAKISGLQLAAITDKRDNIVFPTEGSFTELNFFSHRNIIGSDYKYDRITFDYRKYFPFGNTVLALQFFSETNIGDVPFQDLARFGGAKNPEGIKEAYIEIKTCK